MGQVLSRSLTESQKNIQKSISFSLDPSFEAGKPERYHGMEAESLFTINDPEDDIERSAALPGGLLVFMMREPKDAVRVAFVEDILAHVKQAWKKEVSVHDIPHVDFKSPEFADQNSRNCSSPYKFTKIQLLDKSLNDPTRYYLQISKFTIYNMPDACTDFILEILRPEPKAESTNINLISKNFELIH